MLFTLSYVSKALVREGDPALDAIVAAARARNAAEDVTGALYFDDRLFFQVLEGPEAAVQAVFASIRRDPRHADVRVLKTEDLSSRRFAGWRMKFTPAASLPAEGARVIRHVVRRPEGAAIDAAIDAAIEALR